jgi:hypothetical protein
VQRQGSFITHHLLSLRLLYLAIWVMSRLLLKLIHLEPVKMA